MRFAYADPPYLGLAAKLYGDRHPDAADYDGIEAHAALFERLMDEYGDGWAYSLHSPSLQTILPIAPRGVRVMAWVKPFASFKPGVGLAYAWEPVLFHGGRPRTRGTDTVRDWLAEPITLMRGLPGAKPAAFCWWIIACLNAQPGDTLDDLFPGTGIMGDVWGQFLAQRQPDLFVERARQEAML